MISRPSSPRCLLWGPLAFWTAFRSPQEPQITARSDPLIFQRVGAKTSLGSTVSCAHMSDYVGEAGAGGLEEVGDFEAEHDVVRPAARIDLFEQKDAAIDEDWYGLPVGERRCTAYRTRCGQIP